MRRAAHTDRLAGVSVTITLQGHNNFTVDARDSDPTESGIQTNKVIVTP